jgi:uncharacterized protein YegP (UPF0339 family)
MIEIFRSDDGKYRWHRRSANGQVTSQGQAHRRKWSAKRAARKQFPFDPVVDLTRQGSLATRKPWKR